MWTATAERLQFVSFLFNVNLQFIMLIIYNIKNSVTYQITKYNRNWKENHFHIAQTVYNIIICIHKIFVVLFHIICLFLLFTCFRYLDIAK